MKYHTAALIPPEKLELRVVIVAIATITTRSSEAGDGEPPPSDQDL